MRVNYAEMLYIIHPAYGDGYEFSSPCSAILSVPKAVMVETVTAYIFQVCQVFKYYWLYSPISGICNIFGFETVSKHSIGFTSVEKLWVTL